MSNEFRGTGNLGDNPSLKYVMVKGENRAVVELRIFFDEYRRDESGEFEQSGGFWLNASLWGDRAENVAKLLRKGARVHASGRLSEHEWTNKESGEEQKGMQLTLDDVFLALSRIENVTFKQSQQSQRRDQAE